MAWHYLVWRDRLLSLSRPEGSILQQARASPWYMPRGISQSERLPQDVCIHTLFMQAPYGSLSDCEIPSWNIPGRCPGLLQYRPFGPGKGIAYLSSPAVEFQEIDFGNRTSAITS